MFEKTRPVYVEPVSLQIRDELLGEMGLKFESCVRDAEMLDEWQKTQKHFPDKLDLNQLLAFVYMSKGSIEVAKQKIDSYLSIRTTHKDLFANSHPRDERMINFLQTMDVLVMPKLNRDHGRVVIMRIKQFDGPFDHQANFNHILNLSDIRLIEDQSSGDHIVYDTTNVQLHHMAMVTPMFLRRIFLIIERTLRISVKGVHVYNPPTYVHTFFNMIKPLIKEKLLARVEFHDTLDSLHQSIDKECLPVEYGGSYKNIPELNDQLSKAFDHYQAFFDRREKWCVDESLRPEKAKNDDFYGYQGNFKKLDVD